MAALNTNKKIVSRSEFAIIMGIQGNKISEYVQKGIFEEAIVKRKGTRYHFDFKKAKAILQAYQDESKGNRKHAPSESSVANSKSILSSKAKKLQYEALSAELNYRNRLGELLEAAQVEKEAFEIAHMVRDRLLQIPDRIAPLVAAETDSNKCFKIIQGELIEVLKVLSE